jgi:transcriptional regulator with XRE-family HTH domain
VINVAGTASSTRLRALREENGLTQQEVAEQLGKLAFLRMKRHVGVNADMVAKWERGVKAPSKLYRELLGLLFGVSAGELAVVRPTASPRETITPLEEPLLATLGDAAALLDQLGPAGSILQPRMFDAWRDEVMRRRVLLKLVGLAPTIGLAGSDPPVRTTQPTPEVVLGLDELAGKYQALYHATAPAVLMTPVVAHLQTVRDVLRNNVAPALRRKLLVNRARAATLAGRLAFFDLHDPMSARAYYNLSLEAAREAGDHLQAAAALGHTAFIPAADGSYEAALDYLRGAAVHVERQPHGPVSSWLAAIESEMHTNAGATARALAAVDRARAALDAPGLHPNLPWFDYYDSPRLDGFAGYAELHAQRFDESRATLTNALDRLPRQAVKQRAVFLCDLATVQLHDGEVDEACRVAVQAADNLHRAGYATASGRLREFRTALQPWAASRAVRTLDDQLAALA